MLGLETELTRATDLAERVDEASGASNGEDMKN